MTVKRLLQSTKQDSLSFKVSFEHRAQVALSSLTKPKYLLVTRGNLDQFLSKAELGFDPSPPCPLVSDASEQTIHDRLLAQLYGPQVQSVQREKAFLLYGPARVGKSFLVSSLEAEVVDCM